MVEIEHRQKNGLLINCVFGYLAGVFLSRITWIFFPIIIGPFHFYLCSIALLFMIWTAVSIIIHRHQAPSRSVVGSFTMSTGVVFDQLVYTIIKSDSTHQYYGVFSILGSIVLTVLFLTQVSLLSRVREQTTMVSYPACPSNTLAILFVSVQLLMLAGFRLMQLYLLAKGFSNADRSLFLAGFEIHHIVEGSLALAIGGVISVWAGSSKRLNQLGFILVALGSALVTDEWLYYSYASVTDERYFEVPSTASAICLTFAIVIIFLFEMHKCRQQYILNQRPRPRISHD